MIYSYPSFQHYFFDISEFNEEGDVPISQVAQKLKSALDVATTTKQFYVDYQREHLKFVELIQGIDNERDKKWYASVLLNRLMFIYFLQKKLFLDNGNTNYLKQKLAYSQKHFGQDQYFERFLKPLFFEGFAKPEIKRSAAHNALLGKIPYLNGSLFLKHGVELRHRDIFVPDEAFANLYELFSAYSWNLNDSMGGNDKEINPDVLGYIFEKYINQKAFGAYYTRPEITDYLCQQTVNKLVLDAVNDEKENQQYFPEWVTYYEDIDELLLNLTPEIALKLLSKVLPKLSLLDPACGSGAFLIAALKTLHNLYLGIINQIPQLNDKKLNKWYNTIKQEHPSVAYYIKKQIISNNLYGVDIMEEATEIAKLRLFLTLVASAEKVEQLEPLPNIDFNILCGNSLIGLLRVNPNAYNQNADLFSKSYQQLVNEKNGSDTSL